MCVFINKENHSDVYFYTMCVYDCVYVSLLLFLWCLQMKNEHIKIRFFFSSWNLFYMGFLNAFHKKVFYVFSYAFLSFSSMCFCLSLCLSPSLSLFLSFPLQPQPLPPVLSDMDLIIHLEMSIGLLFGYLLWISDDRFMKGYMIIKGKIRSFLSSTFLQ